MDPETAEKTYTDGYLEGTTHAAETIAARLRAAGHHDAAAIAETALTTPALAE